MKSKYELTISSKYVKNWTYLEAVREFFQNAIDEQSNNPEHTMHWSYDEESEILAICNDNCNLDVTSLLLGETSKSSGEYIGSFGEGYKLAILVLLRENKEVTIYNKHDIWNTYLVNSRKYKSQIPVIEIDKNKNKSYENLQIIIKGITAEEFELIKEHNLIVESEYSKSDIPKIHTSYGDLLTDESYRGKIYVGGLYVYEDFELKYGYNINPEYITLNRDRNMVSSFDLLWNTSRILAISLQDNADKLYNSLDTKDAQYIDSFLKTSTIDILTEYFREISGDKIPVSTQEEYNYFKDKGMDPIIVKEKIKLVVGNTFYKNDYKEFESVDSLYSKLTDVVSCLFSHIDEDGKEYYDELEKLLDDYKDELSEIK